MLLITGATGTIGGEVLRLLARRGVRPRAMAREPARLTPQARSAAEVVRADFDDHASLARAVRGVDGVFLLTAPGRGLPEHDLAMTEAARSSGVRKIVKLSAIGGREPGAGARTRPADQHAPGERALADSGLAWSVLRPSWFASNALRWADAIRADRPVPNMTGTGAQGVVDPRDVAEVAVEVLLTDEYDGVTHVLTGPETLTVPDQAAVLAEELGRPIETVDVPIDEARRQMRAAGVDPSVVEVAARGYQVIRAGGNAIVTDDVARILGRPARTFRTWVRDHRGAYLTGRSPR